LGARKEEKSSAFDERRRPSGEVEIQVQTGEGIAKQAGKKGKDLSQSLGGEKERGRRGVF